MPEQPLQGPLKTQKVSSSSSII